MRSLLKQCLRSPADDANEASQLTVYLKRNARQGYPGLFLESVGSAVEQALDVTGLPEVRFNSEASREASQLISYDGSLRMPVSEWRPNYLALIFELAQGTGSLATVHQLYAERPTVVEPEDLVA